MPRRGNVPKRDPLADPVYQSPLVTKFINCLMVDGKKAVAEDIFYGMKRQDMLFAELEQKLAQAGSAPGQQQVAAYLAERQRMLNDYDRYVNSLYDRKLNDKERLILRVTRLFGECDVAAPPEYVGEVMHYINRWQSTGRFMSALKRAQDAGYPRTMTKYPVQYPTACSPQAWSSGAPLQLLTAMLGLEPHGDHLVVDPALPSSIGRIELLDIPGRWGRVDAFGRGRVDLGKPRGRRS